jgi:hypothetical protein
MTIRRMTFNTTLSRMTVNKSMLTQLSIELHTDLFSVILLNVVLNVIYLLSFCSCYSISVILLNVILLNAILLNVFCLMPFCLMLSA